METIASARSYLDQQSLLAIWYAAYDGEEESVVYANSAFCQTFGHTLDEIVERKRYHLVNPPGTPSEVIAQYKAEDRRAMDEGFFIGRGPVGDGRDIVVLKLGFDQGILGMFKFVPSDSPGPPSTPVDLDADFGAVIEKVSGDLLA